MSESPISKSFEGPTVVNKIEKQTEVWIGLVISVSKMQMLCQLMLDCSTSQIGSKYVCTVFSVSILFLVHCLIIGWNRQQQILSRLKILENPSQPKPSIKFVNRL